MESTKPAEAKPVEVASPKFEAKAPKDINVSITGVPTIHHSSATAFDWISFSGFLITAAVVFASTWLSIRNQNRVIKTQLHIFQKNRSQELEKLKREHTAMFRQEWIDNLRNTISLFISQCLSINELIQLKKGMVKDFTKENANNIFEYNFKLQAAVTEMHQHFSKIKLLANPTEDEFIELLEKSREATNLCLGNSDEIKKKCEQIISITQSILKIEWERVKQLN